MSFSWGDYILRRKRHQAPPIRSGRKGGPDSPPSPPLATTQDFRLLALFAASARSLFCHWSYVSPSLPLVVNLEACEGGGRGI